MWLESFSPQLPSSLQAVAQVGDTADDGGSKDSLDQQLLLWGHAPTPEEMVKKDYRLWITYLG